MKTNKQGVSLIVLVITIIVMAILVTTVVLSINEDDISGKADTAVEKTNLSEIQNIAALAWADAYANKLAGKTVDIEKRVEEVLEKNNIDTKTKYHLYFTKNGVEVVERTTLTLSSTTRSEGLILGTTKDITLAVDTKGVATKLKWSSSNTNVATVVGSGNTAKVTLKGVGTTVITVTGGGDTKTCQVTVTQLVPKITLDKTSISEYVPTGSTKAVQLVATTENIVEALTWSSNNTDVATVAGSGTTATVTLKSAGTAVITVTGGGVTKTCQVTVSDKEPKITLNRTYMEPNITKTADGYNPTTVSLTATTNNLTEELVWSTDYPDKSTIVSDGNTAKITFTKPGTITITASANGVSAACIMFVGVPIK